MTYRGHRRSSFVVLDRAELVELRARQRTYEGAYQRTALLLLGQGAVILKVFDRRFFASQSSFLELAAEKVEEMAC